MSTPETKERVRDTKEVVNQKYAEAARRAKSGGSSCCGASSGSGCGDPITSNLYDAFEATQVPEEALLASLGCGNPVSYTHLTLPTICSV